MKDVDSIKNLRELALFAGAGGGILGGHLLGWRTVCAVEIEPYPATVLAKRQEEGHLQPFPIWDDVCTFDGRSWRGRVDVISGGFPCIDVSVAGKGAGIDGEHSGLWREYARIIREVRPRYVFVENSPALRTRGLTRVLSDLAEAGYDAVWMVMGADDVGAPHKRKRMWLLGKISDPSSIGRKEIDIQDGVIGKTLGQASGWKLSRTDSQVPDSDGLRELQSQGSLENERGRSCDVCKEVSDTENAGTVRWNGELRADEEAGGSWSSYGVRTQEDDCGEWWDSESGILRVVDGVANRVDMLKAIGNGQVPPVAAKAFEVLYNRINNGNM